MANYTSKADIVLNVNGKQAQQILSQLEQNAQRLNEELLKATQAGDKVSMKRLQRELNQTNRAINQIKGASYSTERVLRQLDKATPRELNKALRTLKQQLNGIERGTPAWDAHVAKIRAVKQELQQVNATLTTQETLWQKIKGWVGGVQAQILGATAAATGFVMATRKAVDEYASMDQEKANVMKFTGMSEDDVRALNEEFKKMDTRTPREELNKLAQEAGRLGKSSQEDVLGFVRAADKINVALDDLGDGATLTLSKLTDIFGDEKRLGTERALLSVGSVINELSQNCSASAPYLAEFASRLGGVASQAGLTIQQVLAFGAVLDSQQQNVESSATALSQVMVRMYKDPAKYAKAAGLDVKKFTELVRTDMNAALLELLSTLNQSGGMDVLSPMFADMGENGSRAIQTLTALAGHIDEVKWQQQEANKAFAEATSIDKEYNVQNNTVQASLDKSKKRLRELTIELGEKLYPLMQHIYNSSVILLKGVKDLVDFLIKYRSEIGSLILAIAAYTVVSKGATVATKAWGLVTATANGIASAAKIAVLALRIGYYQLTGAVVKAEAATRLFNKTSKASPWGIIIGLVTLAASRIYSYVNRLQENKKATEEVTQAEDLRAKVMQSVEEETLKEIRNLDNLFSKLGSVKKGTEEYNKAKNAIISQYGHYLTGLINEQGEIINLSKAYDRLTEAIRRSALERGIASAQEEVHSNYVTQSGELLKKLRDALKETGKTEKEISLLMEYVQSYMVQGGKIPQNIIDELAGSKSGSSNLMLSSSYEPDLRTPGERFIGVGKKNNSGNNSNQAYDTWVQIINAREKYLKDLDFYDGMKKEVYPYANYTEDELQGFISALTQIAYSRDEFDTVNVPLGNKRSVTASMTREKAFNELEQIAIELGRRNKPAQEGVAPSFGDYDPISPSGGPSAASKAEDKFQKEKEWREKEEALSRIAYATGQQDYIEHTLRMNEIALQFYQKQLQHTDLSELERLKIQADYEEEKQRQQEQINKLRSDEFADYYDQQLSELKQFYLDGQISKETYEQAAEELEIQHQQNLVEITQEGSKERLQAEKQLQDLLMAQMQRRQREREELEAKYAKIKEDAFGLNPKEAQAAYDNELAMLDVVYQRELEAAGDNAAEKLRIDEAYEKAKLALQEKYGLIAQVDTRNSYVKAMDSVSEWLESDGSKTIKGALETAVSGMSSIFSQLSALTQADLEIQTAAINKRYDAEISRAEGNSYKIAKLEKEREAEIAKAKNEANRKMFAMQVIQAVAQTAQNALNAYGSAAAVPVIGYILAPIAAATAVAAGMLQVAAIKKQQQASEAQGYMTGGFTPDGRPDEVAGVVHAGEWVASQQLTKNPRVRPLLEALDYAQKTNTIGSIRMADVSRSITAPTLLAANSSVAPTIVTTPAPTVVVEQNREYADTMRRLANRLDEPFVTINTVTGDHGMNKANNDYNTLIRNKTPKSRKQY